MSEGLRRDKLTVERPNDENVDAWEIVDPDGDTLTVYPAGDRIAIGTCRRGEARGFSVTLTDKQVDSLIVHLLKRHPLTDTSVVGIARQAVADGLLRLAMVTRNEDLGVIAGAVHGGTLGALITKAARETCNACDGYQCPCGVCVDP